MTNATPNPDLDRRLGLFLAAILSLAPLLLETRPVSPVGPCPPALAWVGKVIVAVCMLLAVAWRTRSDWEREPWPLGLTLLLVVQAGLMTGWHWYAVDQPCGDWQTQHFLDVLNNQIDAPHPFRPLPYGFVRSLERITGDWLFASLAYRWFFLYWLLWASYRLARLYHAALRSLVVLLVLAGFYPWSIQYYWGQPTDPMSHAFFVLAFIYILEDRWLALAGALALGVMAKETAVLLVPAYVACYLRRGWPALGRSVVLGGVAVGAFLATRLPWGWRPGNEAINGVSGLMAGTNLGIGTPIAYSSVPLYENYLQPFLFVGLFVPPIALQWSRLDGRLKILAMLLAPLIVASSLCFSWLYESRNYVPLLPLLTTMALPQAREGKRRSADDR